MFCTEAARRTSCGLHGGLSERSERGLRSGRAAGPSPLQTAFVQTFVCVKSLTKQTILSVGWLAPAACLPKRISLRFTRTPAILIPTRAFDAKRIKKKTERCAGARRADCAAGEAEAAMRKLAAFAAGCNQRGGPGGASIPSECPVRTSLRSVRKSRCSLRRLPSCAQRKRRGKTQDFMQIYPINQL